MKCFLLFEESDVNIWGPSCICMDTRCDIEGAVIAESVEQVASALGGHYEIVKVGEVEMKAIYLPPELFHSDFDWAPHILRYSKSPVGVGGQKEKDGSFNGKYLYVIEIPMDSR